ncbi:hypothetical protein E2562_007473, partial [Oryza meyeriana var. granulata]
QQDEATVVFGSPAMTALSTEVMAKVGGDSSGGVVQLDTTAAVAFKAPYARAFREAVG